MADLFCVEYPVEQRVDVRTSRIRHENVDPLSDDVVRWIPEQIRCGPVPETYPSIEIDGENRIVGGENNRNKEIGRLRQSRHDHSSFRTSFVGYTRPLRLDRSRMC